MNGTRIISIEKTDKSVDLIITYQENLLHQLENEKEI